MPIMFTGKKYLCQFYDCFWSFGDKYLSTNNSTGVQYTFLQIHLMIKAIKPDQSENKTWEYETKNLQNFF